MMQDSHNADFFETQRPNLLGLAYRILGSVADAEDVVQDCYLRWCRVDASSIHNPAAWLTTVCTRRCLDIVRACARSKTDYHGVWLPEPLQHLDATDDQDAEFASTLSTAFLLMLERLTPKERAAYLLRDIFEMDYPTIALALSISEMACRQLVTRAKRHIDKVPIRHVMPLEKQQHFLVAFHKALSSGEPEQLTSLLADDIQLMADGGGKVAAIDKPIMGKVSVLDFIDQKLSLFWRELSLSVATINGAKGLIVKNQHGVIHAVVSFSYCDNGLVNNIYIVRNPEKINGLTILSVI